MGLSKTSGSKPNGFFAFFPHTSGMTNHQGWCCCCASAGREEKKAQVSFRMEAFHSIAWMTHKYGHFDVESDQWDFNLPAICHLKWKNTWKHPWRWGCPKTMIRTPVNLEKNTNKSANPLERAWDSWPILIVILTVCLESHLHRMVRYYHQRLSHHFYIDLLDSRSSTWGQEWPRVYLLFSVKIT